MGVSNLGDLVATAQLDISPFINNTRQLQLYLRGVDNALNTSERSIKGNSDKLSSLKQVYNQTGLALNDYKKLLDKQTVAFNKAKEEVGDLSTASSEHKQQLVASQSAMMATASRVAELQNKYDALGKEIASLSSRWLSFGNELHKSGEELTNIGIKASGVGKALTLGLTTPIVTGVGFITKLAVEYESAFAGVKKTVNETNTTSFEKLSRDIREMSKTLPSTASEIAKVAEVAGQLGIKADDITSFTKVMIDLGESTNLSAEESASAIAKIANITRMTSDEYQKFGSSLVALGNNYATTENNILDMANRMASAGTIAGLTNQEILGMATAISSVGIEAEAGGSAISQTLVAIEKAVVNGGEKLDDFAKISGMTVDEFSNKWKTKPIDAIQAFIKGLGALGEKGESATLVLNDLGLSGIRQSNLLRSLGLASNTLTSAISTSNEAWEKNTALTNEANKRYETTESKLKMLRNEVVDMAIEFGGPLVDALRESLDSVKPWIQSASEMAKAFNDLDKEQQQQIIKWGLITIGIGPALTVFGKATSVIGVTNKALGAIIRTINTASTAFKVGKPAVDALGVASATTASSATGLAGVIGTLGSPYTWGILLGGTVLLAIGAIAENIKNAHQRTQEWGTAVSETEAKELSKFKSKVDETNEAMTLFGTEGVQDVENVKQAFSELTGEIAKLVDENLAKDLKLAEKLGLSDEESQYMINQAEETKQVTQNMVQDVVDIYKRASEQKRQLSAEEKEIVLSAQNALIQEQLELMKFSGKEKEALTKAMNGRIEELNSTQLAKALSNTKKMIEEENKGYKEQKKAIQELYNDRKISEKTYHREMEELNAQHNAKMDAFGEQYIEIQKRLLEVNGSLAKSTPEAQKLILNQVKSTMAALGLSYEEFQAKMEGVADKVSATSSLVASYWQGMSEEARTAVDYWNGIVLDPVTGEVKTNAQEVIQTALQAEGGWEAMQFVLKNANLETNVKISIGEALVANDQWNSLTPEEKRLVTDGSQAIEAILSSKDMLSQWNSMPEEVKEILGSNKQFLSSAEGAKTALSSWNMMTPTQKALTAKNLTGPDVTLAQQTVNSLTGKNVSLDARNNTLGNVLQANANVNSVRQNSPAPIYANNQTWSGVEGAKRSIASVEGKSVDIWVNLKKGASALWKAIGWATGTNYHPGGMAIVNDQKGSTYRELITLPNGNSFIPEGRDVMLPLPKGTKVLKASDTKKLFPRYADGIGFENTRIARLTERMRSIPEEKITATYQSDNSEVKQLLAQLLALTGRGTELMSQIVRGVNDIYDKDLSMVLDSGVLVAETGDKFAKRFSSIERRNKRLRGVPYD